MVVRGRFAPASESSASEGAGSSPEQQHTPLGNVSPKAAAPEPAMTPSHRDRGHGHPSVRRAPRSLFGVPTVLLGSLVVLLADQPPVLHQVELVARGQLPAADDAGEAVEVVHEVLGFADHLGWGDALLARRAFGPETPARRSGRP